MMTDPELVLLDEPAAGLDLGSREMLVRDLAELAYDPLSPVLVLVTHHVEEIPPGFTHALLLRDGRAVAQGLLDDVVTADNLSATFGQRLLRVNLNLVPLLGVQHWRGLRILTDAPNHVIVIGMRMPPEGEWLKVTVPYEPPRPWHSPTFLAAFLVMTLAGVLGAKGVSH